MIRWAAKSPTCIATDSGGGSPIMVHAFAVVSKSHFPSKSLFGGDHRTRLYYTNSQHRSTRSRKVGQFLLALCLC